MHVGDGLQVRVVRVAILAAPGKGRDAESSDQGGRNVVLGRQWVRGAQRHRGTARLERSHEVRRLGRHVQARADTQAVERTVGRETLPDQPQHRHFAFGPFDAPNSFVDQR